MRRECDHAIVGRGLIYVGFMWENVNCEDALCASMMVANSSEDLCCCSFLLGRPSSLLRFWVSSTQILVNSGCPLWGVLCGGRGGFRPCVHRSYSDSGWALLRFWVNSGCPFRGFLGHVDHGQGESGQKQQPTDKRERERERKE